ncbi:MAG: hypothetical protein LBH09_02755 [Peptococcaceae bacterium]|jgi:hypothetical protein|nr:hypothetical protein [Peptococcaceae bacterium]
MPYVNVSSSQHLADDKIERLQAEIGKIISIIPGKSIENCMIQIRGDVKTFMGGKAANATFCEIRMFGKAPSDKKGEFTAALSGVIKAELGELDQLFINFQEYFEWGIGPNFRSF